MANNADSWYQYPNSTDTTGIFEFFRYVNTTADNLFFPLILLVIWVVTFVGSFAAGGKDGIAAARSFTFASFLCSIMSILLVTIGLLAVKFMYLLFILTAVGALLIKLFTPAGD